MTPGSSGDSPTLYSLSHDGSLLIACGTRTNWSTSETDPTHRPDSETEKHGFSSDFFCKESTPLKRHRMPLAVAAGRFSAVSSRFRNRATPPRCARTFAGTWHSRFVTLAPRCRYLSASRLPLPAGISSSDDRLYAISDRQPSRTATLRQTAIVGTRLMDDGVDK